MARGKTLEELIKGLRHETGKSTDPATGRNERDYLAHKILTTQERLYDEYDWPFKRGHTDKAIVAGSRYYDWPADFEMDGVDHLEVFWNQTYLPLEFGIDAADYSALNPDTDERNDPLRKWDLYNDDQFEVWPLPSTNSTVRIFGNKVLDPLVADADRAQLDHLAIIYSAAADILGGRKAQRDRAAVMEKRATDRLFHLKANASKKKKLSFAAGGQPTAARRSGAQIYVKSGS